MTRLAPVHGPVGAGLAGARVGLTGPLAGQVLKKSLLIFVEVGGLLLPSCSIDTPFYLFG
jgi:hypothetical protein